MRRARSALTALAIGGLVAPPAAASQGTEPASRDRVPAWSVELGAVRATPFIEDGNGVTVRATIGPYIGAGLALQRSRTAAVTFGVRASSAAIRVEASGGDWRAGHVQRFDLRAGVERVAPRRSRLGAALFAGLLTGPDDVIPFRRRGRLAIWGGEIAGLLPVLRDPRVELLVGGDVVRMAAQRNENPPMAGGWVGQLRIGVRHGFR
jgi:hypothetical protein